MIVVLDLIYEREGGRKKRVEITVPGAFKSRAAFSKSEADKLDNDLVLTHGFDKQWDRYEVVEVKEES